MGKLKNLMGLKSKYEKREEIQEGSEEIKISDEVDVEEESGSGEKEAGKKKKGEGDSSTIGGRVSKRQRRPILKTSIATILDSTRVTKRMSGKVYQIRIREINIWKALFAIALYQKNIKWHWLFINEEQGIDEEIARLMVQNSENAQKLIKALESFYNEYKEKISNMDENQMREVIIQLINS